MKKTVVLLRALGGPYDGQEFPVAVDSTCIVVPMLGPTGVAYYTYEVRDKRLVPQGSLL